MNAPSEPAPTYTCAACHTNLARDHVHAATGPTGTAWYCTDADTCRARREAGR